MRLVFLQRYSPTNKIIIFISNIRHNIKLFFVKLFNDPWYRGFDFLPQDPKININIKKEILQFFHSIPFYIFLSYF